MPKDIHKTFVKIGEAAKYLGVSIDTLRRWEKAGKIQTTRTLGGTRLYDISTLSSLNSKPSKSVQKESVTSVPSTSSYNPTPILFVSDEIKDEIALPTSVIPPAPSEAGVSVVEESQDLTAKPGDSSPQGDFPLRVDAPKAQNDNFVDTKSLLEQIEQTDSLFKTSFPSFPLPEQEAVITTTSTPLYTQKFILPVKRIFVAGWLLTLVFGAILGIKTYPNISNDIKQQLQTNDSEKQTLQRQVYQLATTLENIQNKLFNQQDGTDLKDDMKLSRKLSFDTSSGVLAASTSASYLEINSDVNIIGNLSAQNLINGLLLQTTETGFSVAGGQEYATLNVSGDVTLNQDLSTTSSPTFTSLNLSATTNQLIFQSGGPTGTVTWTPTAERIITLPDATTTLVGIDTAQTLTNKTISGSSNTFSNIPISALSSSSLTVSAGTGLSGGGTVSLGGSTSLAIDTSVVATLTGTQTLTNKTLTSPIINTPTINVGSDATGDVYYRNSAGEFTRLGIGATNQVLSVVAGIPSWQSVSGSCTNCVLTDPSSTQTITPTAAGAIGLSIAQAAGGTVDVFNVTNNAGSTKFLQIDSSGNTFLSGTLDVSGHSAIGSSASISSDNTLNVVDTSSSTSSWTKGISVDFTANPAANSDVAYSGIHIESDTGTGSVNFTNGTDGLQGLEAQARNMGSGTVLLVNGVLGSAQNNSTGTVTNARGTVGRVANWNASGTITNAIGLHSYVWANAGTITNRYGVYVTNGTGSVTDTGTIGTNYGLYLEDQTKGSTDYAIYSAGGQSVHAGNLRIGSTTAPTVALDVTGAANISSILQVGSGTGTTYSRFGTGTTGHSLSGAEDVLVSGDLEVDGISYLDGGATVAGQAVFNYPPTTTTYAQSSVMINPTAPATNSNLLGIGVAGAQRAGIDANGDLTLGYSGGAGTSVPTTDNPFNIYDHGTNRVAAIDTSGNMAIQNIFIESLTSGSPTGSVCYDILNKLIQCSGASSLTGSGTSGQIAFFNGTNSITSETSGFGWDTTNKLFTITSTATTQNAASVTTNSLSSGSAFNITVNSTAAASNTQKGLNIALSGANATSTQTTYGGYITNTHTGTSSTNVGLYASASGGSNNYAAIFENGNVGIGDTSPASLFTVGTNDAFQVNSSGNVAIGITPDTNKIKAYGTGGIRLALETTTSTAGSESTILLTGPAGLGVIGSAQSSDAIVTGSVAGNLIIGNRTGQSIILSADSSFAEKQLVITETGLVGIMSSSPDKALEINSATGANLRLTYNDSDGSATNYADFSMSSGGNLTIAPSGGTANTTGIQTISSILQVGSATATTYSRFGTGTSGHSLSGASSLLVSGDSEIDGSLFADGNVTLGSTSSNTISLTGVVNTDLNFIKEVARTIQIADSTSSNTAGAALTIKGAAGTGSATGGNLLFTTGAPGTPTGVGGSGGSFTFTASNGSTSGAASSNAGSGGGFTFTAGNGATPLNSGNANGGNGGSFSFTAGTPGTGVGSGSSGTPGTISLTGGTGVTSVAGGAITITGGAGSSSDGGPVTIAGGSGSGSTNRIGGAVTIKGGEGTLQTGGGALTLRGGDATGNSAGNPGGALTLRAGNSTNNNAGGAVTIDGGQSGNASTGNVGGAITITGGQGRGSSANAGGAIALVGGTPSATGTGGAITLTSGAGGSTSGGSGDITINNGSVTSGTVGTLNIGIANTPTINFGDGTQTLTIDIGGVSSSNASSINIATNGTAADTISIGNSNSSTTLGLTGGDDWSITSAGLASFGSILQVGSATATTYSRFGTASTGHSLSGASSLLVSGDLEVDGTLYFDGNVNTTNLVNTGTFTTSGGIASINASSNFATNINTGTSNGAVSIGNSSAGALTFASGAASSLTITNANLTLATTGASGANGRLIFNSALASGNTTTEAISLKTTTDLGSSDEVLQIGDSGGDFVTILGNGNVGIGTTSPDKALEINSATGANLRLTYNDADGSATNYADFSMSSGGNLTIAPSGGTANTTGIQTISSILQVGSATATTYSRFGTGTTGHSLSGASSVLVSGDLEVDGTFYLDGGQTIAGDLLPATDNTYDLGSSSQRWAEVNVGPGSVNLFSTTGTSGAGSDYIKGSLSFSSNTLTLSTTKTGSPSEPAGGINLTSALASGQTTNSAFNITTSTDLGASDELLQIGDSGGTFITVLGNGNVGIGDTSPDALLDIDSTDTTGNAFGISGSSFTTGEVVDITATWVPTGGGVIEGMDINFVNTPSSSTDVFRGIDMAIQDATTLGNAVIGYHGSVALTNNAAKTARVFSSDITTSSTTADTLESYFAQNTASGALSSGTRTIKGFYSNNSSTAASTGGTLNLYGAYLTPSSTLSNPGTSDTVTNNVFGTYISTTATIASDCTTNCTTNQYGLYVANGTSDTDGTSTKYGIYVESPTGADTNYAAVFAGGNVGIADTTPSNPLTVTGIGSFTSFLQVGSETATTYSRFGTGTTGHSLSGADDVLVSGDLEVDGTLYFDGDVNTTNLVNTGTFTTSGGAANINASGTSATNIGNSTGALTLASGGTSAWTNTAGGLTISTATSGTLALSSAGVLNLTSALSSGGTTNSAFNITSSADLGASDELLQIGDSAATFLTILGSGNVGIMTTAPDKALEINSADGSNLRLTYNDSDGSATNYADFSMSSGGNLTIAPSGGTANTTGIQTISSILQVGSATATTYSRFGTGSTGHSLSGASSLLVTGDLELDGSFFADGNTTLGSSSSNTISLTGVVNTDLNFVKEVARTIQIADSTTSNTAGAALTIKGAAGAATNAAGGAINVTGGAGAGNQAGGAITITAGAGTGVTSANGGDLNLIAGAPGTSNGTGGNVTLRGGEAGGATANGGSVTIRGGNSRGSSASTGPGAVSIIGGSVAQGTGVSAPVLSITGGSGQGGTSNGGGITITSGAAGTSGNSGDITINSGAVTSGTVGTINIGTSLTPTMNLGDGTQTITIDIGVVTSSNASTINLATNSTAADTINIGNSNASTALSLTSGTAWSVGSTGIFSTVASSTWGNNSGTDTFTVRVGTGDFLVSSSVSSVGSGDGTDSTGAWSIAGPVGGASSATTGVIGGDAGTFSIAGGLGGSVTGASGTNTGGLGGALSIAGGAGGSGSSGSTTNNGGAGAALNLTGGAGGAGNATGGTGGAGANVNITGGAGGNAATGGVGGSLYLVGGAAGTGGSSAVGNVFLGANSSGTARGNTVIGSGQLADAATDGFFYLVTTTSGAPSGTPTSFSGRVAMIYDDTNDKLCAYNGSWKCSATLTDYAEWAPAKGAEIGDIVTTTTDPNPANDPTAPFMLGKSSSAYDTKLIGVVSKYAEESNQANGYKRSNDYRAIALVGRVPVKVSTQNGPISKGDFLTSSSIPGVAMKATKPGFVVGKAMEDYSANGVGLITIFVQPTYADPGNFFASLTVDDQGNLIMPAIKTADLKINTNINLARSDNKGLLAFNTTTTNGQTSYEVDVLSSLKNMEDKVIEVDDNQAIASGNITQIQDKIATQSSIIADTQATTQNLAAQLASAAAALAQTKSDVDSLKLTAPDVMIATESALLADLKVTSQATFSGMLAAYDLNVSNNFKSLGETSLGNTTIAGNLIVDGTFSISQESIDVIKASDCVNPKDPGCGILYLQKSPLAQGLDIFDGKVFIDNTGSIKAQVIAVAEFKALSNKSTGSGKILHGQSSVEITTSLVNEKSRILVTPTTSTTLNIAVTQKTPGEKFTVSTPAVSGEDISFDWFIVNEYND